MSDVSNGWDGAKEAGFFSADFFCDPVGPSREDVIKAAADYFIQGRRGTAPFYLRLNPFTTLSPAQ